MDSPGTRDEALKLHADGRNVQLPTLLGQQCWQLLRPCWRCCANWCNNSQQCWDLQCIVGRIHPIRRWRPCLMRVRGPNIVALRVGDHGTKEMLGVVGSKVWPGFKLCATTPNNNNVQQGVTTDVTYNIQQCWKLLANNFNVASVCNGLKNVWVGGNLVKQDHLRVDQEYFTSIHPIFSILPWTSRCNGRTALC